MYHGETIKYKENPTTGMATAEIAITNDQNNAPGEGPTHIIATLNVYEKIELIADRIKVDLSQAIQQIRDEVDANCPQEAYDCDENGNVT